MATHPLLPLRAVARLQQPAGDAPEELVRGCIPVGG